MTSLHLDPILAKTTGRAHIGLFVMGCLLLVPAGFVFFVTFHFGVEAAMEEPLLFTALSSSTTGTLAWAALGLLLFKRSDPRWHLACWSAASLFGGTVIPSSIYWLGQSEAGEIVWIFIIVIIALLTGIYSIHASVRGFHMALRSLWVMNAGRIGSENKLASPDHLLR